MYVIRTLLTCYNIGRVHGPRVSYVIPSLYVIRMYVITSFHCILFYSAVGKVLKDVSFSMAELFLKLE